MGRGRPKGAKSFVNINMETLNNYFGARQFVPVSRVWLEKLNIVVDESQPNIVKTSAKPTEGEVISMNLTK